MVPSGSSVAVGVALHRGDRSQAVYGSPDAPLVAKVLGVEIHTKDADEMQYVILQKLTDRYASERGIAVKPREIDAYVAHMKQDMARMRAEDEARCDDITRRLQADDLPRDEHEDLSARLDALNEALTSADAAAESEEDASANRQVAAAFIRQ